MINPQLTRIEALLVEMLGLMRTLVQSLADEEEEPPARTLDGEPAGNERDQGQSL